MRRFRASACLLALVVLLAPATPAVGQAGGGALTLRPPVAVNAIAVEETPAGLVGAVATISVAVADGGSGHIFIDTVPLTQLDMQGSARLAVRVASSLTDIPVSDKDFFFVVRSASPIIGGPSAGAVMTVAAVAALKNWTVNQSVMMTGAVDPDGGVGPVGGVAAKAFAAAQAGATLFLFPAGQDVIAPTDPRFAPTPLATHCRQALRIACEPVTDVEEALRHMTGHVFEKPNVTGNVTDARFKSLLKPAATALLDEASADVEAARVALASPSIPAEARPDLASRLASADVTMRSAREAFANETYYTTASRSFQASIEARYIAYAARFFASPAPASAATAILRETSTIVERASRDARAASVDGLAEVESLGAAQTRATEAEALLASARSIAGNATAIPAYLAALHDAAYAAERAETVQWWLEIGRSFPPGAPIGAEALRARAREALDSATETVTYVEAVLMNAGGLAPPALAVARQSLADGERDLAAGYTAAALFEALEGEVRASVTLELSGYGPTVPVAKIEAAEEKARLAILTARARGAEPVLAVSYYEFAESLVASQPADALSFYNLARVTANIGDYLTANGAEPRASRYVGEAGIPIPSRGVTPAFAVGIFVVGVLVGGGLAALAIALSRSPPRAAPAHDPIASAAMRHALEGVWARHARESAASLGRVEERGEGEAPR
ncbi:MAG TPA: S16 family serine protease [Candidatus Thermoplasmatota archaeon]|nr:S16 family serine protease [Candidatus Thermoplasmatota archaeon]